MAAKQTPAFSTNVVSKDLWHFAGYDTPEDAGESLIWAKSVGNVQAMLDCMAPEITKAVENDGKTDEERSQTMINQLKNVTGYQILSEVPVAKDEVLMQVRFDGQVNGQTGHVVQIGVMKRIAGEWKLSDEYGEFEGGQSQLSKRSINPSQLSGQ